MRSSMGTSGSSVSSSGGSSMGPARGEVSLSDWFGLFRRQWLVIALSVVLGVAAAVAFLSVVPRSYTARAVVTVHPITTTPFDGAPIGQQINTTTEISVLQSTSVAELAAAALGGAAAPSDLLEGLSVTTPSDSQALQIEFTAGNAAAAARGANVFADQYLVYREQAARAQAAAQVTSLEQRAAGLQDQLADTEARLAETEEGSLQNAEAATERQLLLDEIGGLRQQAGQLSTLAINPGQVVDEARPPPAPSWPRPAIVGAAGALLGLLGGLVLAYRSDSKDARLRGPDELARESGAPTLASIAVPAKAREYAHTLATTHRPHGQEAGAYRLLAAKVASTAVGGGSRSVLLAGPGARHSTHWPATNLAVALARHGHRVLLVLGPGLPFPPGAGHPPGAGGRGPIPAGEAFQHARPVGDVPRLGVIGIDEVQPDNRRLPWPTLLRRPAPAARGDQAGRTDQAGQAGRADHADHADEGPDFVLVEASDAPELAEVLALAQHADAVVLVAEQGKTDRGDVAGWATALRQVDANLVGAVLLARRRGRAGREQASATATRAAGHPLPSQPPTKGESEHRDQSFQPKSRPSQENSSVLRGR